MSLNKYFCPTQIFISKMRSHSEVKNNILNFISNDGAGGILSADEKIHKSDYHLSHQKREWLDIFYREVKPCMEDVREELGLNSWSIHQAWYQWYERGDFHKRHIHPCCSFTAVYFLKLPDVSIKTKLYADSGSIAVNMPEISEGDVLFFPSAIMHESPPNKFDDSKIVVAFNCDFHA